MSGRLHRYRHAAQRAVERHGGGWRGLWSVAQRALKVARALGVRGLLKRLRQASAQPVAPPPLPSAYAFPPPAPLASVDLRIGVMAHVFYPDLIEEMAGDLAHMPLPYDLLVSVMDAATQAQVQERMGRLPGVRRLIVRVVPNRGRDIAPLLVTFREEVLALDLVGHIHTKKSLYTGSEQGGWRRYLLSSLFGSPERLAWIFGMFQAEPRLGMVYPESYQGVPLWAHTWLSNADVCEALAARMGFAIDRAAYIDFPAGSMFWARVAALRPLYDLALRLEDFPEEAGQTDGTLQHAVERLFALVVQERGDVLGILPTDGALRLYTEGERNWQASFEMPLASRLALSAVEARLVTTDIFDTLVVRPFLTPEGARQHLDFLAQRRLGFIGFADLRGRAEVRARLTHRRDPTLDEIYAQMQAIESTAPIDALKALELSHERDMLRARDAVVAALAQMDGRRIAALSDMYLPSEWLRGTLPAAVTQPVQTWWMSCETGLRKDELGTWPEIARREGVDTKQWLHLGDNEYADVQLPQKQGLLTMHVLRPAAFLDVVPALRGLRHRLRAKAPWPEQLWRGLLALRFSAMADRDPTRLAPRPRLDAETAGYAVLGPLLLDYLTWLGRLALQERADVLLFLSREGHLLAQAWHRIGGAAPGLGVRGLYFLASRRAAGFPTLLAVEYLARLLQGAYTGRLGGLLQARLGDAALQAVATANGQLLDREVYLPEMRDEVVDWLTPVIPSLIEAAAAEREHYLRYWHDHVGKDSALVSDIGYAGTIQSHLSRLVDRPLAGGYFALRQTVAQLDGQGTAHARYHDGRHASDEAALLLRHDLLLESLLTAPEGQFLRFVDRDGRLEPEFAAPELTTQGRQVLGRVHQGALAFIDDVVGIAGEDVLEMTLDPDAVTVPFQCLAEGIWEQDGWLSSLVTVDAFTGRGRVPAAG